MINENELISIIVPVYNTSGYLSKCIESIISQSYPRFELILIDDGSEDNSYEICKAYQKEDERVIVLHQKNAGVSAARNKGLSVAKGKYFCFVDSDDFIENNLLERLYKALKKTGADMSICGFNKVSSKGVMPQRSVAREIVGKENISKFVARDYLGASVSSPWGKLYRNIHQRKLLFDNKISMGEDLKFNIQYFEEINKIVIVEDCLYNYRDNINSLTNVYKIGYYEAMCNVYEATLNYLMQTIGNIDTINLKNVNYKLFSYCVWFISQDTVGRNFKGTIKSIKTICDNKFVQKAVCDLPKITLAQYVYKWGIRHKCLLWLWLCSVIKSKIKNLFYLNIRS